MLLNTTTYINGIEVSSVDSTTLTDIMNKMWLSVNTNISWVDAILTHKDNSEELWAKADCEFYKLLQYEYALLLTGLIQMDITENGLQTTFEYYDAKYNVLDMIKNLGCNNISLVSIFNSFGITIMNLR